MLYAMFAYDDWSAVRRRLEQRGRGWKKISLAGARRGNFFTTKNTKGTKNGGAMGAADFLPVSGGRIAVGRGRAFEYDLLKCNPHGFRCPELDRQKPSGNRNTRRGIGEGSIGKEVGKEKSGEESGDFFRCQLSLTFPSFLNGISEAIACLPLGARSRRFRLREIYRPTLFSVHPCNLLKSPPTRHVLKARPQGGYGTDRNNYSEFSFYPGRSRA